MYVCMYLCMYLCMYVCMCVLIYVYVYVCVYLCMYVRIYVPMYICMYVCICMYYVCVPMYVCMYARVCVCVCLCVFYPVWTVITNHEPFRMMATALHSITLSVCWNFRTSSYSCIVILNLQMHPCSGDPRLKMTKISNILCVRHAFMWCDMMNLLTAIG